jgi:hypothetical protein
MAALPWPQNPRKLPAMAAETIQGEVLFEFHPMGRLVRVCAVHVDTDTEVVLMGPASVGQGMLQQAALRKLAYVLRRARAKAAPAAAPALKRQGRMV